MTTRSKLTTIKSAKDFIKRHEPIRRDATIGRNDGTVDVPGMTDWVYVKIRGDNNQVAIALKLVAIDYIAGMEVEVGYINGTGYAVLGLSSKITYPNNPWMGEVANHATNHERRDFGQGGKDPVNVFARMVVPIRARATIPGTMSVFVETGWYPMNGIDNQLVAQTSPAIVAQTTARRCDLLYIGTDNALHWVTGTESVSIFVQPSRPTPPATEYYPVAWVYTVVGQTTIAETDIEDPRTFGTSFNATATAHNLLSGIHGDTTAAACVRGDIIVGIGVSPKWTRYALSVPVAPTINFFGAISTDLEPGYKSASSSPGINARILQTDASGSVTVTSFNATVVCYSPQIQLTGASNQLILQSTGVNGIITWTPTTATKTMTIPDASGTVTFGTGTQYQLGVWSATNTIAGLGSLGTANAVLQSAGAGANPAWSSFLLTGTAGGTTTFAVTNAKTLTLTTTETTGLTLAPGAESKTLTLTYADTYNLTIPSTGTAALLGTANVFTANQTISNTAPQLDFTDTTASAKSLTIAVDSNLAQFRESAGAAGSLLVLDLANSRLGVGLAAPLLPLNVRGTAAAPTNTGTTPTGIAVMDTAFGNAIYFGTYTASPYGAWVQVASIAALETHYPLILNPLGGDIGIGTTSPGVMTAAGRGCLTISGTTGRGVYEMVTAQADNDSVGVGNIQWTDINSTASDKRVAMIYAALSGTTANKRGGALVLFTRDDNASAISERMRIDRTGQVGIGTASPTSFGANSINLEVQGTSGYGSVLASTTNVIAEMFASEAGSNVYVGARSNHALSIVTNNTPRINITAAGQVAFGVLPSAFVAGDKYLVMDASGNIHLSALGPAS